MGGTGRERAGWERGGGEKGNRIRFGGVGAGEKARGPREQMEISNIGEWQVGDPLESTRDPVGRRTP